MNLDDLLRELDDLPQASSKAQSTATGTKPTPASRNATSSCSQVPDANRQSFAGTPYKAQTSSSLASTQARKSPEPTGKRSSIDLLLNDLDDIDLPSSSARIAPRQSGPQLPSNDLGKTTSFMMPKCMGLWLGGTKYVRGRNGSAVGAITCCDSIRCTKCDFRVSYFSNKEWATDVDYLFFRNNFPTESKLAPKLLSKPGSCAYCCQCSWFSTVSEAKVDYGGELRWICAGH